MKIILTIIFLLLAYTNYRHLNIGFLSLYSIDEYAFHGSLLTMYDGLISLDIKKLFSFGFYSYGFGFFFLNLLATAPFIAIDNTEMSIYIPRVITSFFALGSVWFIYKVASKYVDKYSSLLIALIILTMPGFYRNALWFHPDWMMTFFVVLSIYFFSKDEFKYKKYFWWAIFALGVAISVKVQAITFLPFVFVYVFYDNFQNKNFDNLYVNIKLSIKSFFALLLIFILFNPYVLHPSGFKAFISSFLENMKSNATNHGLDIKVTIMDKVLNAIDFYYLNSLLFIMLLLISLYLVFSVFKKSEEKSILPAISLYFIANIIYLLFMVNKDWQHYYLSIFTVVPLLVLWLITKFDKQRYYILGVILLFQVITHIFEYKSVFTDSFHPEKQMSQELQRKISDTLISDLKPFINKDTNILISPYQPFDFKAIGLKYTNIHVIYGPLSKNMFDLGAFLEMSKSKDPSKFYPKDFIVLSKNDIYFHKEKISKMVDKKGYEEALKIIENFNNSGDLGYEPFKSNEYFYIWRKKK
jgi:4-amino-4-deoxy-L-arabinose transferase-like glycosyltransferase